MNKKTVWNSRLITEFIALLTGSMVLSVLLFYLLGFIANNKLNDYLYSDAYVQQQSNKALSSLQEHVSSRHIASTDLDALEQWVKKHPNLNLLLVHQGLTFFDPSGYQQITSDYYSSEELTAYFREAAIQFEDTTASVYITGFFGYELYTYVTIAIFILCSLLFLSINGFFIRKKLRYIRQLSRDIQILEGGNLEYEIQVNGYDELAGLASSLNSMRHALFEQMQAEAKARNANHQLVSALSHDIRTPLTTQMGYLEIIKDILSSDKQLPDSLSLYIGKCLNSCVQLKEMTDSLFEYFLVTSPDERSNDYPLTTYEGPEIFLQFLSDKTSFLEEKGFQVQFSIQEKAYQVQLNHHFMLRIMDNLFSNIQKYASSEVPIHIRLEADDSWCYIHIENTIRPFCSRTESTRIGTQSVAALMKSMSGASSFQTEGSVYTASLQFPLVIL